MEKIVTITEAANLLGVTRQRMHQLIKTYSLKVKYLGGFRILTKSELRKVPKNRPSGVHIDRREKV